MDAIQRMELMLEAVTNPILREEIRRVLKDEIKKMELKK